MSVMNSVIEEIKLWYELNGRIQICKKDRLKMKIAKNTEQI